MRLYQGRHPRSITLFPPRESSAPNAYWRSLHYYNLYRLVAAGVFVESYVLLGPSLNFGSFDPSLFFLSSIIYALLCVISIVTVSFRWPSFGFQLALQITGDVVLLVVLMYASGGVRSGLGLLLVPSLAATGLISRGRLALFYASLAAIAVLLEHSYRVLYLGDATSEFFQVGMLSISYFATAWMAHTLAKRAMVSEQLAVQRGIDLENLAEVNQLVIQAMQDGVLVVDGQGRVRQRNQQAEKLLGVNLGKDRSPLLEEFSHALAERFRCWQGDPFVAFDPLRVPATGKQLQVRFVPVGEQSESGALVFLEDSSVMQVQAQQLKLAALGRLTANIAHEIRNPLSAVSHAAQLLQEDEGLDATEHRLLQIIQDNTYRLDRLVQDVLQLNRRDRAQVQPIDPHPYLRTFADEFCQVEKIPPGAFSLEIDTEKALCFDRAHLNQVLWNLCRNAWRHSRKQDMSIRLCVTDAHVENVVQIDVIDDGPGVEPALQGQLFEPFFTTAKGGTGLGLYIAREVCEANGASLDYVEVAPGGQFRICCKGGTC